MLKQWIKFLDKKMNVINYLCCYYNTIQVVFSLFLSNTNDLWSLGISFNFTEVTEYEKIYVKHLIESIGVYLEVCTYMCS